MDNIVDVIVLLFFVVSLLSGLFKKKQKGKRPNPTYNPEPAEQDEYISIPDLFGGGGEKSAPKPSGNEYEKYGYQEVSEPEASVSYTDENPEDVLEKLKYVPSADRKKVVSSDRVPVFQQSRTTAVPNQRLAEFKTKLRDQSTLQDYFLISEILGKPKALSR